MSASRSSLFLWACVQLLLVASPCLADKGAFRYVLGPSLEPVHGVRLESTVPAVDLALQLINNNSTLLPGYSLSYHGEIGLLEVSCYN